MREITFKSLLGISIMLFTVLSVAEGDTSLAKNVSQSNVNTAVSKNPTPLQQVVRSTDAKFRDRTGLKSGTNHGGGGNGDRLYLQKLIKNVFTYLKSYEAFHSLGMPDGYVVSADKLSRALESALATNDIKIINSNSDSDDDCQLRDYTNSCVEFLSDPVEKQLSIDLGRIRAMFVRNQITTKFDQDRYFIQQMIHESFRMAEEDDHNYRYSDTLASLYVSFYYGGQQVESFLEEPDLCLNPATLHENCHLRKVFPFSTHKPSDGSKATLNDLIGAKFYSIESNGNTYITFRVKRSKLMVYQEYLDNQDRDITSHDCGPISTIKANSLHCLQIYQGVPQKDLYFQINLRKPRGAPAFLKVFIGNGVGYRTGWVK